jgi:hypothetical protein
MATSPTNELTSSTSRSNGGGRPQKHTYRLKFQDEGERPAKDLEFEAGDAGEALIIAHSEARSRSAELWRDGKKLCTISRKSGGLWEIGSSKQPRQIF